MDGISDDGENALSVIGFIGSVFSPWYRWSGRKAPENNVCMNVATYGKGARFAMTDRGRGTLKQTKDTLTIGPSSMHWDGNRLLIEVNEVSSPPFVSRIQGTIIVTPGGITDREFLLTDDGAHVWRPLSPASRIEVDLGPRGKWSGTGYFDSNFGTRAMEADCAYWTWGRFPIEGGTRCFYEAVRRDGTEQIGSFMFHTDGRVEEVAPPPRQGMRRSLWGVRRATRGDPGSRPRQVKGMLDAPFYCRSVVRTVLDGQTSTGVHEALDLNRFRGPWLMPLLAVRVPRNFGWPKA
ncbi:Acyclic carotenoid 1,2-hydratase [Palleronia abyssalis]|uniref:Acyclic carotenoid 1,2-hydratase n=1 Tax=Palleronia abyssalis TaxID=1501240 RepID=A0A2R8BSB7_9RHOB|nr:Acyclic carotenoid 1,2-hydratase [Palleronia abyssalis]